MRNNKPKSEMLKFLFIILIILFLLNLILNYSLKLSVPENNLNQNLQQQKTDTQYKYRDFLKLENSTLVSLKIPAVDSDGKGVTTFLAVEVSPGTGRTLVDIENLLFWADTQQSIRVARAVAGNITGINVDEYDMVYSIDAEASVIGGPSAGAALTIATIAALESKTPKDNVMITGRINSDGSIGPVSDILQKAQASKQANADIFLVPLLQSRDVIYEEVEHCDVYGVSEFCYQETRPKKVNIKEEVEINVIEISNIEEAINYYFD